MQASTQLKTTASQSLLGTRITGSRSGATWDVVEEISVLPGLTPGAFSYTFKVHAEDGREAFLKASDLGMFSSSDDFLTSLLQAASAHNFERQILDHCHGNRMDRVVTAIDYGDFETHFNNVRDRVFFIVFEIARGDLRAQVHGKERPNFVWIFTSLKNFFVGMQQLHSGGVCHNDFKPANALVFTDELHKIADLGRATAEAVSAPHGQLLCAGDFRFAAPEQLYDDDRVTHGISDFDRRRVGDLFSLGSVTHYMLSARMVTPEIVQALPVEHKPRTFPGGWQDSYLSVLPYWRLAFENLVAQLRGELTGSSDREQAVIDAAISVVEQLCEPDPRLRGHPAARGSYGIDRYISQFDLLARRSAIIGI